MNVDMSQFYQVFFDETAEHLANMETLLLGLDVNAPSNDDLNAIFRAAHSIKGGSGTFGFKDMAEVTHVLESLLDKLRRGELVVRTEMIDAFLQAGDVIKSQLEAHRNGEQLQDSGAEEVCARLSALSSDTNDAVAQKKSVKRKSDVQTHERHLIKIEFDVDDSEIDLENLFEHLKQIGELDIQEKPNKKSKRPRCRLTLSTLSSVEAVKDLFEFVVAPEKLSIEEVAAAAADNALSDGEGYGFFNDLPGGADPGYGLFDSSINSNTQATQNYGRRSTDNPEVMSGRAGRRDTDKQLVSSSDASSIRVNIEKVDQLINLVGELVITQAMLAQTVTGSDSVTSEALQNGMDQLARNTRDLQESVMSIRMMPIAFVFSRFPRMVRDLAGKLNKQIELKTIGESTELDKGVIEKIADPLTHLVRNSLDHGIETPEKRRAAGKPEKGTLTLRAFHQGGNIVVEVIDDGGGLNRNKILAKAKERGMQVQDDMTDHEVHQLIFEPGFSTAEVVTDVSGRGVGMDVVKRNIQDMGGRVEIDSKEGEGTRISIRLPLTLAILEGMSIAAANELFIIPLTFIIESLQPAQSDVKTVSGKGKVVQVRGEYLPVIALSDLLRMRPRAEESQGIMVIIEANGYKAALLVDDLVGQHQVVIKSLETNYRKVPHIAGATIMGDGKVALILDVASIVKPEERVIH